MISQDQVIKEYFDFMERSSSLWPHGTKWSMGCVTLWVEASHSKSSLGVPNPCDNRDTTDLIFHVTFTRPGDQRALWLYGRKSLILYPHSTKFITHKHCDNGYIMVLDFNVISQDHLILVSSNIMGKSPSKLVIILSILVAKDTGKVMVLDYQLISQGHVFEGLCDFMGRSPLRQVTILSSVVVIRNLVF